MMKFRRLVSIVLVMAAVCICSGINCAACGPDENDPNKDTRQSQENNTAQASGVGVDKTLSGAQDDTNRNVENEGNHGSKGSFSCFACPPGSLENLEPPGAPKRPYRPDRLFKFDKEVGKAEEAETREDILRSPSDENVVEPTCWIAHGNKPVNQDNE